MEKLLKWSLQTASHDGSSGQPAPRPDPEQLAQLFGAPDDPQLMKDAMAVATNPEATIENRETALDNLEMLIENLDNANNLENMKMWPDLLALLDDENETIRKMVLWVVGTAVQNNPQSQGNLSSYKGSIEKIMALTDDKDVEVRLKALYALNSALSHCESSYQKFEANDGWELVKKVLSSDKDKVLLRGLTLLQAVTCSEPVAPKFKAARDNAVIGTLITVLKNGSANAREKALNVSSALYQAKFEFTQDELEDIRLARRKIIDDSDGSYSAIDFPLDD